ncbi:hypothetical protein ACFPOU_19340 [Massilia jejuensis]|uniref:Uncharacterized protein n=1 Tax=Massilia jejuensis TaxID=648894 RepID=A0ABW0PP18_9BURK
MKSLFARPEKFLYRRNTRVASFLSGTRFGVVVAVLVMLVSTLS